MIVKQSGIFRRRVKKLYPPQKKALDAAIEVIMKNPEIGEPKTGDLAGVQVYKYKYQSQQYLLAYRFVKEQLALTLLALGTHENFYRDLKKQ